MCNKQGALTWVPTAKTLKQYAVHMMKKDRFSDEILQIISDSTNVAKENAAECLCSAICNKYEDAFASVAENRGIASSNQKMEASKVEAMLNEAGVNWMNARILFCHMKQFFGRSLFDSERI